MIERKKDQHEALQSRVMQRAFGFSTVPPRSGQHAVHALWSQGTVADVVVDTVATMSTPTGTTRASTSTGPPRTTR